jgi:glutamine cyclotransferase
LAKDAIAVVKLQMSVEGIIDLSTENGQNTTAEVLNGIAYNPKTGTIFVTGKTGIKYLKSPFLSNKKKV